MDKHQKEILEFIRKGLPELLKEMGVDVKGKRVLDVGASGGLHAIVLKEMGADVHVIDPKLDEKITEEARQELGNSKCLNAKIEDLSEELKGTFDLVFAFRAFPMEKSFLNGMQEAVKTEGKVLVGSDLGIEAMKVHTAKLFNKSKMFYSKEYPNALPENSNVLSSNFLTIGNHAFVLASEPVREHNKGMSK